MGQTRTKIRYRRPRCLKGVKHCWRMGAALVANEQGNLKSADGSSDHLKGVCGYCGKRRIFHPHAATVATPTLGCYRRPHTRQKLVAA